MFDFEKLPRTVSEAINKGGRFYYTGKPCKQGHLAPKDVKKSYCLCCKRKESEEKINEWFLKHQEYGDYHKNKSSLYWLDKGRNEPRITARKEASKNCLTRYYTGLPCSNGHYDERYVVNRGCVVCLHEEQNTDHGKQRYRKWYNENIDEKLEKCREYSRKNYTKKKEYVKQWKKENKDKISVYSLRANSRRLVNIEKSRHFVDNEFFELFTFEIEDKRKQLEELTGVRWDVDHIVPLKGTTVSGLHVPWNMQLLSKIENLRKGNRVWPDMPQ